eukprot:CAMPEP_0172554438 /NCGR_PEP_ID=MMETSP1067-20121228/54538_1 /TAXON_ID=265564 ORGANISM="Thalassiosira punctigera, Strain Tpunct2005C2" /NCGR_SAMPLE_ID=MMETSP1067 /ASSEMBLY_ACC=CAM_ASM_000444 /LENGTH=383 /DNA_ID=CAMNT_0013342807 /DNA_START=13 /DNA_END=1164 /DNA_ORIENTATION=+
MVMVIVNVSSCLISFLALASFTDIALKAYSHPSSKWSTHRDGSSHNFNIGLYRRGGSNGTDAGNYLSASEDRTNGTNTTATSILSSLAGHPLLYSACSVQGERQYMEDEYFVERGRFAAVYDGHGGAAVSRYLRQNLYASFQAALPTSSAVTNACGEYPATENDTQSAIVASALRAAFGKVDSEVCRIGHWSFQGSTALAVVIHENIDDGSRLIVSANVGDSRAVLSRNGMAIDLTKDHKPNDGAERKRIESLGGTVDWCGAVNSQGQPLEHTGVYRINGNLALSRAIGDRSERPWVSNLVDIAHQTIEVDNDSFVLLATDGLFDVMTSQEVVSFVNEMIDNTPPTQRHEIKRDVAKYVVEEAAHRGSSDNITVLVLWINEEM